MTTPQEQKQHEPGCCVDRRFGSPRGCTDSTCMRLPDGKSCDDCANKPRCETVFGLECDGRNVCDWHPRRFRLAVKA